MIANLEVVAAATWHGITQLVPLAAITAVTAGVLLTLVASYSNRTARGFGEQR